MKKQPLKKNPLPFDIQSRDRRGRVADAPSKHWVYRLLPRISWPYAQLARWDRPIGWQLLLWPCWWSVALAVAATDNAPVGQTGGHMIWASLFHLMLFFIGAVAMRGAGCTYNDLVDEDIDNLVERTRSRPLPSRQVTRFQAKMFLLLQALVGFFVLIQFNQLTIWVGIASLLIVALYPFMKRITNWPQLCLGAAFSWGALLGWTATRGTLDLPALLLYLGAVCWTIGYDTIYAHQDREDDALVGVRSTARLFASKTKYALIVCYGLMLVLFALAFIWAGVSFIAFIGLGAAALHMFYQIKILNIDDGKQCLRLFRSNFFVGLLIFSGLVASVIVALLPMMGG